MGATFSSFWDQTYFIPKPTFTGNELPDQTGKVIIVTGGYTGIGLELSKLLYQRNATIYIAGRNPSKADTAIGSLKDQFPNSQGRVKFLQLDLSDLSTIKESAQTFLRKEQRLDVLVNNAGIMVPPKGSVTKQGYDLQLGTNILGPYLFTILLQPTLVSTARTSLPSTVRVTWASSLAIDIAAPQGGLGFDNNGAPKVFNNTALMYGQTKAGNVMLAVEAARRWGKEGIISVAFNPGHLQSELDRHSNWAQILAMKAMRHPAKMGAYTELFAGWAPEVTAEKNGANIIPWGRIGSYNAALQQAVKSTEDGGEGRAKKLWEWCEKETKEYL